MTALRAAETPIQGKPHIVRITLSRQRVRWCILVHADDATQLVGFKQQTQFESFGCACFIASCLMGGM